MQRSGQQGIQRAGLLLVMAHTVREMRDDEVDPGFMRKVTKLAMADLSMNKVILGVGFWMISKRGQYL
jgi:hypothetical protein